MSTVDVRFENGVRGFSAAWVRRVVVATLKREGRPRESAGVLITGDRQIRALNRRFLRHDYATDVISFGFQSQPRPQRGAKILRMRGEEGRLGDIVVSVDTARRVSAELGITCREELARYLVHGTLHLLGYDDKKPADRRRMHARQELVLKKVLK